MNRTAAGTRSRLAVIALLVLVSALYAPGLRGPFLLDDFPNFVHHPLAAMDRLDIESLRNAAFSNDSGPSGRPLAALTFSLNYWFAGQRFDPFWFKLTNLVIHLLNALLVLAVMRRLLPGLLRRSPLLAQSDALALCVTAAWALHPLQLTSVLYVVQRMTSLAALCVLAGLLVYLYGRQRLAAGRWSGAVIACAGLVVGVAVGVLFKETALLLPLYAFVVEYTVLERYALPRHARRFVHALFGLAVILPGVVVLSAWAARPALLTSGFGGRSFTLVERLLTECRVLFEYVAMMLTPRPSAFGLFHDDVVISRTLQDPPVTLLAAAGWLLLVLAAVAVRVKGHRLLPFALGWYLAGHALESTVFALELMHEHRNYLASLGVLTGVLVLVATAVRRWSGTTRPALALVAVLALAPGGLTLLRAATWGDAASLVSATLRRQPESPRAQLLAAQYLLGRGALGEAHEHFATAARLEDTDTTALIAMLRIVAVAAAGAGAGDGDGDAALPLPPSYDSPLARDQRYLAELGRLLRLEVDRRLASGPLTAGSRVALSRLRVCIQAGVPECTVLATRALDWYASIYRRQDVGVSPRAMMAADHARVLVALAREAEALDWLQRAWRMAADDPQVLVLQAVLQLHLGDIDAADRTTRQLAGLRGRVGFDARQLQELREAIAHARTGRVLLVPHRHGETA